MVAATLTETRRLVKLHDYEVVQIDSDEILDRYVALAAEIAGTPIAYFNIVGKDQVFTKAAFGAEATVQPRDDAFCAYTVVQPQEPLIVADMRTDIRFANHVAVTQHNGIRFYAGFALVGGDDRSVGALCVIDTVPHVLTEFQIKTLKLLSHAIEGHLELRRSTARWNTLMLRDAQFFGQETRQPGQHQLKEQDARLILELEQAIERQEFVNYYQPKVDLSTHRISGVEALVRWNHPTRGLVQPLDFIPLLEKTGLIIEAGSQVLSQAMFDWKKWMNAGLQAPQIAVNVAAYQFLDPDFVTRIDRHLAAIDKNKHPLSIEITESSLIANLDTISKSLEAIRRLGIPVALDDFGTGFSSLAYIATLPVDTLKIDRSFVSRMLENPKSLGLVKTILSLAHGLGMDVVAEGVETQEQEDLLGSLHCEHAQGYLYSRPVPADAIASLLMKQSMGKKFS